LVFDGDQERAPRVLSEEGLLAPCGEKDQGQPGNEQKTADAQGF
jgi:hypothetical protein